jgi:hypothetical protein
MDNDAFKQSQQRLNKAMRMISMAELVDHKRIFQSPSQRPLTLFMIEESTIIKDVLKTFSDENITSAPIYRYDPFNFIALIIW